MLHYQYIKYTIGDSMRKSSDGCHHTCPCVTASTWKVGHFSAGTLAAIICDKEGQVGIDVANLLTLTYEDWNDPYSLFLPG